MAGELIMPQDVDSAMLAAAMQPPIGQQQGPNKEQQWRMQAAGMLHALVHVGKYQRVTVKQFCHDIEQLAAFLDRGTIPKTESTLGGAS